MPDQLTTAAQPISTRPSAVTRPTPKRAIRVPVTKLGEYIASTCHWMPSVASVTEWPQPTMASGAEVIIRFMVA